MSMADYVCDLRAGDVRVARELWSRQLVVTRVASPAVLARSEAHATLHPGHAVVSVDGASTAGLSARRFAALWQADGAPPTRLVRFRDRQRADLETAPQEPLCPHELQRRVDACRQHLWAHQLADAERVAETTITYPLLLLARVEVELVRVLVSSDALVLKRARHTAKQVLASLQALSALPSLSCASALSARMALAEALLLMAALHFVAEKIVAGVNEFRRCAAAYAELRDQVGLGGPADAQQATKGAGLPPTLVASLRSRLRFGLGILQLASASAFQGAKWLGAVISDVGADPASALDQLIACCEDEAAPRAPWASLALFHCFRAIRKAQQAGIGQKYALQVAQVQRQALLRYPNSVLHLWSASLSESTSRGEEGRRSSSLEYLSRALSLSPRDERAHVLRFDAGYRYFIDHNFERSAPLFMDICKCASAPSRLRGLCSVFLAAGDLFLADPSQQEDQRFRSVRLLLRSALRYLDDARAKDAKSACLHQRVSMYLDSADWYLYLLPCEILYVYCSRSSFAPLCSRDSQSAIHHQHQTALAYLDRFSVQGASVDAMGLLHSQGKVIKLNATTKSGYKRTRSFSPEAQAVCEWSVLRASMLYHLGEFEPAQQQLETLKELLPTVASSSFVRALVVFYSLQIQLQHKLAGPETFSEDAVKALVKRALQFENQQFEYSYIYSGKLKALVTLWTKTATGTASSAQLEVVKREPRHAASATIWVYERATRPAAMKLARPKLWPQWTLPILRNTFQTAINADRIYDWLVQQSERFDGQPFWIGLADGAKVAVLNSPELFEDVLKTHFETFDKGPVMTENLRDLLGDGIFAVDGAKWVHQRKTASNLFTLRALRESMTESIHRHALELNAILERHMAQQQPVDLFNLLNRFTIETFAEIGFGVQLGCLVSEADHPFQAAFDSAQRVLVYRFMRPRWFWKLQRYLNIGVESGLKQSIQVIDDTVLGIIAQSFENRKLQPHGPAQADQKRDIVSLFLDSVPNEASGSDGVNEPEQAFDPIFLRDIVVNFLIAGRDTTAQALSWFFFSLSQHPAVARKIRDEIADKVPQLLLGECSSPSMEQSQQLVYLEAALRETLRLYPSVPANIKQANKDVMLSDGTFVRANEGVLISSYVLGRMAHVWGPDAKQFRPERWIEPRSGKIAAVSAFQFNSFHAGPRMCLGMNLAMMEMKIVAAMVLAKFRLELVPGQRVTYDFSLTHPIKGQLLMNVAPAV